MAKEYTTIQLTKGIKRRLDDLKFDYRKKSYEAVLEVLLKMKNIIFKIERESSKKEVRGALVYDKLIEGWKIVGYRLKQ